MKKGSIGATLLALVLVLLFISSVGALGYLWWRQSGHTFPKNIAKFVQNKDEKGSQGSFSVTAPADGTIFASQKSTVQVLGTSKPNSVVIITTSKSDKLLQSNEEGNFESSIDLQKGINFIKVTNIDGSDFAEKTVAVFLSDVPDANPPSGSSVDIVADKKVFWGKVKGILKNNLTLITDNKTKEVNTSENTKFEFPDRKSDPETDILPNIQKIIVDNIVVALGKAKDEIVAADSLVVYKNSPLPVSSISYGTVGNVDTDDESIVFIDAKGSKIKVFWNSNSKLSGKLANSFAKIVSGSQIFLTSTKNKLGNLIIDQALVTTPPIQAASSSAKKN